MAEEKRTLLIIEDNELNREMLSVILEEDYNVLTAENGAQGLEVLNEHGSEISLILLDIQMPVMEGYEFLDIVFREGRFIDIPIIVTTANDTDQDQIKCLTMGASDFVVKPYKPEIVQRRVASLIRLRETTLMLHKVERDEVTGLYNRESFAAYANQRLKNNPGTEYDMICMEVESYLSIHSRYGEEKCYTFLRTFSEYMESHLPKDAILGRIDSAQIAILIKHMPYEEHIKNSIEYDHGYYDFEIPAITINVGVYLNIDKSLPFATIMENALTPLESVRFQYGKYIAFYDDDMKKKQNWEQVIVDNATRAIEEKHFQVWYQPKHGADSDTTEGAEALVRWIHPDYGFISPGDFIPVFESNGFVSKVDLYVIETICADLRRWIDEGKRVIPISANISQMDFDNPELTDVLEKIVDKYKIPHELVHFEITESADYQDKEKKSVAVHSMKEKGFIVELDDFGSGYSNLSILGELPIDVIKLDMSLVRNMFSPKYDAVLKGVLYTAAALKKKVVVEGIESIDQVEALKEMCDGKLVLYFQGYYYSKPLPADQFEVYLAEN